MYMLENVNWKHVAAAGIVLVLLSVIAAMIPVMYVELNPSIARAGVVKLNGPITSSSGVQTDGISPDSIATLTKKATDSGADVVIYEINSPGGSVVASKDAARVVKEADVPTVCLMKEVAASGGYWIASACDHIVADSLSITGSIGVTSTYLEFSGLLDRYGVEYVNLTSGEYKDMGSRWKNLSDDERDKFDNILNTVHDEFIRSVAENRNMSAEEVRSAATGEVYLGTDAKDLGLVDTLGGRDTAKDAAKNLTGASELRTSEYEPPRRIDLFSMLFNSIGEGIAEGLKSEQKSGIQAQYDR